MRFGVYLPTFAWPDPAFDHAARVRAFARKAEDLVLGTCADDVDQLERFATEIVARFKAERT